MKNNQTNEPPENDEYKEIINHGSNTNNTNKIKPVFQFLIGKIEGNMTDIDSKSSSIMNNNSKSDDRIYQYKIAKNYFVRNNNYLRDLPDSPPPLFLSFKIPRNRRKPKYYIYNTK